MENTAPLEQIPEAASFWWSTEMVFFYTDIAVTLAVILLVVGGYYAKKLLLKLGYLKQSTSDKIDSIVLNILNRFKDIINVLFSKKTGKKDNIDGKNTDDIVELVQDISKQKEEKDFKQNG